ncbi:5,6-dimethylbenzimidazole synthase [Methylobacterium sp. NEAU 140]|uniref:5,6-dimethylbenzimidazole synthase n=1 Tax=Methylobacterium sp. NEAU 140 TaxID=3064945 RepID=UPI0027361AF5|nr:5,6-dimethylbenzimidazole synthase [Methylobacterium sp. NEAU 140]MDP4026383.1 5,6-dimethylbenzimidazole synthase [Methylobacterium sp. NEAU 140]
MASRAMPTAQHARPPVFDAAFTEALDTLFAWRRDVRRFRTDPVDESALRACLAAAHRAPSVGNSRPWRFVRVSDPGRRAAVADSFGRCNEAAAGTYEAARAAQYRALKLAGLREAPVHLAAFCDAATGTGLGLGRATMPETLAYSVVGAVQCLWLAARARGLGVGWVSILEPEAVAGILAVPPAWRLVAYLCLGWPQEEHADPELERHGWQPEDPRGAELLER